jgi:putative transposase
MNLESNNNGVYSLNYHLIFVTKYRRRVLTEEKLPLLDTLIFKVAEEFNVNIKGIGSDMDHVRVLFSCQPTLKITMFIKKLKGISSRGLRQHYPQLLDKVYKQHLWSNSYFLCSTCGAKIDVIEKYIQNQGKKGY